MNRILTNLTTLMVLALMTFVASCSNSPKYADLIPDDASVLMSVDVKQMAEQGNLGDGPLKAKIEKLIDDESMPAEAKEKMKAVLDDPAQLGVDLRVPLLFTIDANSPDAGMMFAQLHSASKLKDFIETMSKSDEALKLQTKGDLSYIDNGTTVMAFNDDVMCVSFNSNEKVELADIEAIFAGERSKTLKDSKALKSLFDANGIASMLVMGNTMKAVQKYSPYAATMPDNIDYKDVAVLLSLESRKGAAVLTSEVITDSEQWKDYMKKSDDILQPIDNDMLKLASKDGFAMVMSLNGKKLMEFLNANGLLKNAPASDKKLVESLATINGGIVLSMEKFDIRNNNISMGIFAKTTDDSLSKEFGNGLGRLANVGYTDNITYVTLREGKAPLEAVDNPLTKSDVKGLFYCRFNFESLKPFVERSYGATAIGGKTLIDAFSTAELSYLGEGKCELAFNMRDTSKYPLEIVSDQISSYFN